MTPKMRYFEITEKEASGKERLLKEGTQGKVGPTELQQPQESPCREVKATGPRLACAHLQRPWLHPRTRLPSSDHMTSLNHQQGRPAPLQAEHCPGTRGSQSIIQRAVVMYPEGMKGNEPTNGEDRFPRSPGYDNWKAESLELNSLDTTVTRKRNSEAPSARVG